MKLKVRALSLLVSVCGIAFCALPALAQTEPKPPATYPALPSETPAKFTPTNAGFDFSKRDVMIPMRDGVKLHTVILIPKGAQRAPILLTRTPYDADKLTSHAESSHLGPVLNGYDNALDVILEGGYLRVVQDVRGKHGSEGDYVVNRPLRGPQNPTPVDHATDTWDTIDWLVKNVPESNGKVGILGISYDGFLPLMALVDPHPALKVSVPMNPMVDGWLGDDWFHYGAFRPINMGWIYNQVATRKGEARWWTSHYDDYDMFMQAGSTGELGRRRGLDQLGFWNKLVEHPAYDAFWRDQAVDKLLAKQPLKTPVMLVHSLWDQEDIYGAPAVYKAIEPKDIGNDKVFLVIGPWHHGQMIGNGNSLGAVKFGSDTALYFRQKILGPFLAQYLKDGAPKADIAPVTAFETGTNAWRRYSAWPPKSEGDKAVQATPLYLRAGLRLNRERPAAADAAFEEYISDPAKPVPYRTRPIRTMGYEQGNTWSQWLVDDQREASGRPDVVTFLSDSLTEPMKICGEPIANLVASTSGSDADWVVKLIDVYPDEVAGDAPMGGYQLMIAADIFRGRYRESFDTAKPIAPDTPLLYRFGLPTANHVFLPGHRIMVQVQSSWFPLYDRNPQTFVPNIFWAKPTDYKKATQRIYHASKQSSFIELPLVAAKVAAADNLEARLGKLAKEHQGKVAIAVKNLDNNETVSINADEVLPTASLIKFPVMLETYMQVQEGKVKLEDMVTLKNADKVPGSGILTYHFSEGATFPMRDAVRIMMVYSDNTATNLILDKIGIAPTGERMKAWGFPSTKINAKVFKGSTTSIDPEATKKYGLGSTTARDMVGLLEKLYRKNLATPEACQEMIGHMKKCEDATKLKRFLPEGIEVAHKTGSVSDVKTDAGILYLPTGPVAVCVLTAQNADKAFKTDNAANILIGKVGKEVHDYFSSKKKK